MGELLLADGSLHARLVTYFTAARRLLEAISIEDTIRIAFPDANAAHFITEAASRDVHIGFIAPNEQPRETIAAAATQTGFAFNHGSFPSSIMSRDLGERIGQRRVPTQIFKAYLKPTAHSSASVEAFVPDADPEIVRGWIREGVGTHIALGLRDASALPRTIELVMAAGFVLPAFMQNRALTNQAEDVTAFYADGSTSMGPVRLEFFHAAHPMRATP